MSISCQRSNIFLKVGSRFLPPPPMMVNERTFHRRADFDRTSPTMKQCCHHRRRQSIHNLPAFFPRMMISVDHKSSSIGLMQSFQQQPTPSSSSVNHFQSPASSSSSSTCTIYDNNHPLQLTEKKSLSSSSSRIRLGLRCLCSVVVVGGTDKQQQPFDQLFAVDEQTTNISERILDQCLPRLTANAIPTLILLTGQYQTIRELRSTLIFSLLTRLLADFTLRLHVEEYSREKSPSHQQQQQQGRLLDKSLVLPTDTSVTSSEDTSAYLDRLCSSYRSSALLIEFELTGRFSPATCAPLRLFCTHQDIDETTSIARHSIDFPRLLLSLSLSLPSTRQKHSFHFSHKRNSHEQSSFSLTSFLHQYVSETDAHFLYLFGTVQNSKQFKPWTNIQRLIHGQRRRMSRDSSSVETVVARPHEEIWVDGPLSTPNEIWIDGPRKYAPRSPKMRHHTPKHRSKPMHTKAKISPLFLPSFSPRDLDESNAFETESVASSHCHLPVLPVFKDHSLLPFRPHQTLPKPKPIVFESPKVNLQLSTNQLNDDLEMLEKTLETLLIPSPIVPNRTDQDGTMTQSLHRIEQLSSTMSNDEKNKRLSRIVSPTRFDKLFVQQSPSVPSSPLLVSKNRHSRTPTHSFPTNKKPKAPVRTTSLAEGTRQALSTSHTRPSIFHRLFGLRSSSVLQSPPSSPLISPLSVTLDSHDDLMPLTTSSTASSASGRASSSGYESMSNTVLDEMIPSTLTNGFHSIKIRNKSARKEDRRSNSNTLWNSPTLRDKSYPHQRLSQLKHRQNELKLELAMTKSFLLMDKNKSLEHPEAHTASIPASPMHSLKSNVTSSYDEETELERDIEYLERRLVNAKSQLVMVTSQKCKQLKA